MIKLITNEQIALSEIIFQTSRSGGKGGQNVNKVETKVEIIFDIENASDLSPETKRILFEKLGHRLVKGAIKLISTQERTQLANKKIALKKLEDLLNKALVKDKIRVETKPKKSAIEKRISDKKLLSEKKLNRKILE